MSDWPLLNAPSTPHRAPPGSRCITAAAASAWASAASIRAWFSAPMAPTMRQAPGTRALERPATGVMRHADAGYDIALDCAKEKGLRLPGILGVIGRDTGPQNGMRPGYWRRQSASSPGVPLDLVC